MTPAKCIGIWGRLFGHKFYFGGWMTDEVATQNHCQRCGMPKGGWPCATTSST